MSAIKAGLIVSSEDLANERGDGGAGAAEGGLEEGYERCTRGGGEEKERFKGGGVPDGVVDAVAAGFGGGVEEGALEGRPDACGAYGLADRQPEPLRHLEAICL